MSLRAYLSVPYILASDSLIRDGDWIRIVRYPELPGCVVEGFETVRMIDELDEKRVTMIVSALQNGVEPPVPRPALSNVDVEGLLSRLGLERLIPLLDELGA
ncbi:hypothetical protein AAC03nite_34540 [Alicyclobacillus acidoterrestris]|uniref:hypothetical protein n=1 Tax=Alicyclobacillus suci TaxID=2816080 RepID=UPI001191B33B|nr:hypothetical protein [Alicyclobacillus suci]GEO27669.1 hypothetical protein AAC03nite_34540 [Alicyclobacillus acidoterrestris]